MTWDLERNTEQTSRLLLVDLLMIIYTPWSKYMAQSPKGRLIQGLYKPIHDNCAIYFYPGVYDD